MKNKEINPWFDLLQDVAITAVMFVVLCYIGVKSDEKNQKIPDIQVIVHETVCVIKK